MSLDTRFRDLCEQARQRDEKRSLFHRHLLLIASGALTLLTSLGPAGRSAGSALVPLAEASLQAAWPLLGLSILSLAVALHGEVHVAVRLVQRLAKDIAENPAGRAPTVVKPRAIYAVAEKTAYVSLALTVLALVMHGVSR